MLTKEMHWSIYRVRPLMILVGLHGWLMAKISPPIDESSYELLQVQAHVRPICVH